MIFSKLQFLFNCRKQILLGALLITVPLNLAAGGELLPPAAWHAKIEVRVTPSYKDAFGNGQTKISLKDLLIRNKKVRKRIKGEVTREEKVLEMDLLYSFSEKWLFSAYIPFLQRKQTSSLFIVNSDSLFIDPELEEMIEKTKENLQSEEQQGLADVSLQAAYVFTYTNSTFFRGGGRVKLPTGTAGTPYGMLPLAIGDRQVDLYGFLHYTILPPIPGFSHNIRGEFMIQFAGVRKTMEGEEGDYYGGNQFDLQYTATYEKNNWFYDGGGQLLLGTGSTIAGEEQNDASAVGKIHADIGYGNLSDLEKSPLSFPYQIRMGLDIPLQGRNVANAPSWKLTSIFYF
ncbi:MAG: hypothetical protein HQM14_06860 [SAR324 cluster bacterium]|nr:hypothetical protein [SAR324 cluster bacterium]